MISKKKQNTLNEFIKHLKAFPTFDSEIDVSLSYDFNCLEYKKLKDKYHIEEIAGKGDSFTKAKRLLHYLAPRLAHCSWYDNHIQCNSLKLLEYSLNNEQQGINCLNKAKILAECLLSIGIPARRIFIGPYSPYDSDSHVVVEFYCKEYKKWIMIDPTIDGYFINKDYLPLSILEIRNAFINDEYVSSVYTYYRNKDLKKVYERNIDCIIYFAKNVFAFFVEQYNGFDTKPGNIFFTPKGYSLKERSIKNIQYRLENLDDNIIHLKPKLEKNLKDMESFIEPKCGNIESLYKNL